MPDTRGRLVPYELVTPGWEAVYTGEKRETPDESTDEQGHVIEKWSVWPFGGEDVQRDAEIKLLNDMQRELGQLDENVRKIRAHISSLAPCDSGVPVTVDELLEGIGRGNLRAPAFRNGCDHPGACVAIHSSQPRQLESMQTVYEIVRGRLDGKPAQRFIEKYPHAKDFVRRTYEWLPPRSDLTELQNLLVERMLLPFDFFTKASHADPMAEWPEGAEEVCDVVMKNCYEEGGRGPQIDAEIAKLAGLPKISMAYPDGARTASIDDPQKKDLYVLCCALAHGLHTLADCHHSTFRWIENWIYAIGTGKWGIPTRKIGTERQRVGRLLFGYLLAVDKWLLGIPMQFLLLDLGHVDLGFDPKNEIVRVYAYLGAERTPVKMWLVACLCMNLMYNTGGLLWRNKHKHLLEKSEQKGISVREWMDSQLKGYEGSR